MKALFFLLTTLSFASDHHPSGHRRLADPISMIASHYDYLVVGSGYGASVAALRLAEMLKAQNQPVPHNLAILERGREWLPGDFPESSVELLGAIRNRLNPLGLLNTDTDLKADLDMIGASGLGGTSLLNAAITLRALPNVWDQPMWPDEIRNDFLNGTLEQDYQRAEAMLMPNHGPCTLETAKSKAHLGNFPAGFPTGQLTLNINHEEGRVNHGVQQQACTNCGNCCGGCNIGAKNTLTTNYLPAAKNLGAKIFTQIEVVKIEKLPLIGKNPARYLVHFNYYFKDSFGIFHKRQNSVTANNIFLGAGSAGTTAILMRSESSSFPMSETLGTRVSGNGDVLGFVYNSTVNTNIASHQNPSGFSSTEPLVGQTITVYGDYRAFNRDQPLERQFVMLDGAIPRSLSNKVAAGMSLVVGAASVLSLSGMTRVAQDMVPLSYPSRKGALNHSMLLLACGHDSCSGRYKLSSDGHSAYVEWPGMQDEASYQYIDAEMKQYAARLGGTFVRNPRATIFGGNKLQTAHPLGGAPTGNTVREGTVNHRGQLFDPSGGPDAVHDGIFVVDAAMVTHSFAAPPLIQITALAERSLRLFVDVISQKNPLKNCEILLNKAEK